MKAMELKKGYTREELNVFMQQAFREKRRVRRTPSGGWETCSDASPEVPEASEVSDPPRPASPKGLWQRLRDRFGRPGSHFML
jgi:hypothetical protein